MNDHVEQLAANDLNIPKPAVLTLSAVAGLPCHTKHPHHFRHTLTAGQLDRGLTAYFNDLLCRMLLPSWHLSLSQSCDRIRILSSDVASFKGGAGQAGPG